MKGITFNRISREPLGEVEVFNLTNKAKATSNNKGEFLIEAKRNDVLIFKLAGYQPDTVLLINLSPLRRYLSADINSLNTVNISGERDIRKEYAQSFNKANAFVLKQGRGLIFHPSLYFSKEGRNARRFVRMLKSDEKQKVVDRVYNLKVISKMFPLQQPELDAFYLTYKPTIKFVKRLSAEDFKLYLEDSYRKFKLLPPEKRVLPKLK
ncbi:MAG: hypothetical protein EOO90_11715 [Pedobacter sp.]|nr:MAG: hypothetical protein EOO90_11715 [Pedobacter sp.]